MPGTQAYTRRVLEKMNPGSNAIYCNRCGFQSTSDAQFCQSCGDSLRMTVPAPVVPDARQISRTASAAAFPRTVRYAGFWIRVVASLLDWIIVFVAIVPTRILLGSSATLLGEAWQMPTAKTLFMGRMAGIGFAVAAAWLYRAGMESSHLQGTLGKLAVQIKVTDLDGNRISFGQATERYLAKLVSVIVLGIGYLLVGFTARKQGLHDIIAGTLVQYR